jgi:hypothetical protein
VAGNPARFIRPRFPAEIATRLQRLAWWDWNHEQLRAALPDFRRLPVDGFLDKYEQARAPAETGRCLIASKSESQHEHSH